VIHGQGITPDCVVPMTDDEEMAVLLKRRPGLETMDPKDQEKIRNSTDPQLDRARDLLKGILIYSHRSSGEKMATSDTEKVAAKNN
jgi:C-terminal processing protease CtpA/Prc